jgi:hypothetical protein
VWLKVRGGLPVHNQQNLVPNSDADLYRTISVMVVKQ